MIEVTKLNGTKLYINEHYIEIIEETPDTVITMTTGRKIIAMYRPGCIWYCKRRQRYRLQRYAALCRSTVGFYHHRRFHKLYVRFVYYQGFPYQHEILCSDI